MTSKRHGWKMNYVQLFHSLLSETRSLPRSLLWLRDFALVCGFLCFRQALKAVQPKRKRPSVFTETLDRSTFKQSQIDLKSKWAIQGSNLWPSGCKPDENFLQTFVNFRLVFCSKKVH